MLGQLFLADEELILDVGTNCFVLALDVAAALKENKQEQDNNCLPYLSTVVELPLPCV